MAQSLKQSLEQSLPSSIPRITKRPDLPRIIIKRPDLPRISIKRSDLDPTLTLTLDFDPKTPTSIDTPIFGSVYNADQDSPAFNMALPVGESDNDESYDLVEQLAAARESLFRRSGAGDRSSNNTLSGRVYRAPRLRRVRSGRTIGSDDEEEDLEMRLRRDRERAHKKRRQRQRDELAGKAGETAVKDPAVVKDSWMDWREVPRTLHHRQTTSHRRREKKIACL